MWRKGASGLMGDDQAARGKNKKLRRVVQRRSCATGVGPQGERTSAEAWGPGGAETNA